MIPDLPTAWGIVDLIPIAETFSSRIWKVRRDDGSVAIVKDLKDFSDVDDELRGAHYLRWRNGEGAVRLLGLDGRRMLIEYGGDELLSAHLDRQGDRAATEVAAELLARLLAPSDIAPPRELQPLRARFAALFDKAPADRDAAHRALYLQGASIAARLLSEPKDVRPLHGDLHHDNILHGVRGWLAIDPKGVLGDPGFDAANLFYNPLDRDDLCRDPGRIAFMAEIFARVLTQDPRDILDHAIAYGCLSAAWHAGDNNERDETRELSVAEAIRAVRLSF